MEELVDLVERLKENKLEVITACILMGLVLLSFGIFIMGSSEYSFLGSRMVILGSGICYVSLILLVFIIE